MSLHHHTEAYIGLLVFVCPLVRVCIPALFPARSNELSCDLWGLNVH